MAEEEVRLGLSADDGVSVALERIIQRLNTVERKLEEVAVAGKAAGKGLDDAMGDAEDSTESLGKETEKTKEKVKGLGDESDRTSTKIRRSTTGLDDFAKKAKKAGKSAGGLGSILGAFKIAGLITGVFALAGGISALAAGGAIAIGGLAPMIGVLGVLPALFLAVKLSTLAFKLAAAQLEQPLTRIKSQFTDLGPVIAGGGLGAGLDYFADSLRGLARATGLGLGGIGAEIGLAAREAGNLVSSRRFLDQISIIFEGMRPIVYSLSRALIQFASGFLNLIQASIPPAQDVARVIGVIATGFNRWTQEMLDSGSATQFMFRGWDLFRQVVKVMIDLLGGVFTILRIGSGYADEMGMSIFTAARNFRLWTESAQGQARINQYFQDSLPALREMGKLLGMLVGGFASLGSNQNVAPLLQQIREQLAPALTSLVTNLTGQTGLGPALITTATNFANLLAGLDFSGLTMFVQAVGQFLGFVLMLTQNVPGANFLVSALLASFLGFKILGPIFSMIGKGADAFIWVRTAMTGVGELSLAQKLFAAGITKLGDVFRVVGAGIVTVVRLIGMAFMANPVIAIITIIIGLILLLWFKCEWFRNAVTAAWEWIAMAAGVAWDWIVNAVGVAISWIVEKSLWLWNNGLKPIWIIISTAVRLYIMAWIAIVKFVVIAIAATVMWLWENVIKPVWGFISAAAEVAWNVIKFIVQTVIFVIAAEVAALAWVLEQAWNVIATSGKWVWETILGPIVNWFVGLVTGAVQFISDKWRNFTGLLKDLWATVSIAIGLGVDWVSGKWTWLMGVLGAAWNIFYDTFVGPKIEWLKTAWSNITTYLGLAWQVFVDGISSRWNSITSFIGNRIEDIKSLWQDGTTWLSDFFAPIGSTISKVWESISYGAGKAADVVKGAWNDVTGVVKGVWNTLAGVWNDIPSVQVPDWVPSLGGHTFSLPKLPTLWHGGPTPGGAALVGEHGPEPLVRGGRVVGMLGMGGPEVANLPSGGYVVPNLSTLSALPGLARSIPPSVAAAVAASVPGYRPAVGGDNGLRDAVEELADAVRFMQPTVSVSGDGNVRAQVLSAMREFRREEQLRNRYSYTAGRG